jgi:hypothetical protein
MDLRTEIAGITDVKFDCTVQELTGYINTLAFHFGGNFSEEDVMTALRELEEDDESDVVLVRANPGTGYPIDKRFPWCVIHTRTHSKFVPPGYDDVPA